MTYIQSRRVNVSRPTHDSDAIDRSDRWVSLTVADDDSVLWSEIDDADVEIRVSVATVRGRVLGAAEPRIERISRGPRSGHGTSG